MRLFWKRMDQRRCGAQGWFTRESLDSQVGWSLGLPGRSGASEVGVQPDVNPLTSPGRSERFLVLFPPSQLRSRRFLQICCCKRRIQRSLVENQIKVDDCQMSSYETADALEVRHSGHPVSYLRTQTMSLSPTKLPLHYVFHSPCWRRRPLGNLQVAVVGEA